MQELVERLVSAAWTGKTQLCRDLVAQGAAIDAATSFLKQTALCRAAEAGHEDTCLALLDMGAGVNVAESDGWTPLHRAALKGHASICALLFNRGANLHAKSFTHETPLNCAIDNGHLNAGVMLLDKGAMVDCPGELGRTPLIQACTHGNYRLAEELLKRGANASAVDALGNNALTIATMNARNGGRGDLRSVFVIIAYGGNPSGADEPFNEFHPAQAAAMGGFTGRLLQVLDASPQWTETSKLSILRQLATCQGHTETVAVLDSITARFTMERIRSAARSQASL